MSPEETRETTPQWTAWVEKFEGVVVAALAFLLVGLIAMGRHVLEIDLHHIEPLILFGFSSLLLALAASYFLVKRASFAALGFKKHRPDESGEAPKA